MSCRLSPAGRRQELSDILLVSTRKGLFTINRGRGDWSVEKVDFLADNVSLALRDARSGFTCRAEPRSFRRQAASRRRPRLARNRGAAYPAKPEGLVDKDGWGKDIPYTLLNIFSLESGGWTNLACCGAARFRANVPLGRQRSELGTLRPLWDDPKRQQWMGGGTEWPAIYSICVDPRDSRIVRIGISCGGVWETRDGGATWACRADGMFAAFMPPDQGRDPNIQDPHRLVQSPSAPDRLWVQHQTASSAATTDREAGNEVRDVAPSSFGFAVAVHPGSRTPPGLFPASRMNSASPSTANSS